MIDSPRMDLSRPWPRLALLLAALVLLPLAVRAQDDSGIATLNDSGVRTSNDPAAQPLTTEAEILFARGRYRAARRIFERIERLAVSTRERGQAVLAQADCLLREGEYWEAYQMYAKAIDNYASFVPFNRVLEIEFLIAEQHFAGVKGSFLFIPISTRDKAIEIYDHIRTSAPYSELAPRAAIRAAQMAVEEENYPEALTRYDEMISEYQRSPIGLMARLELAKVLIEYAELADGDGLFISRANLELERFLELAPSVPEAAERLPEAQALSAKAREIEARRLLALGEFYQREHSQRLPASRRYLRQVRQEYPDTQAASQAGELLVAADAIDGGDGGDNSLGTIGPDGQPIPALSSGAYELPPDPPLEVLQGTENSGKWLRPVYDLKGTGMIGDAPLDTPADTPAEDAEPPALEVPVDAYDAKEEGK